MSQPHVLILDYKPSSITSDIGGTRTYVHANVSALLADGFHVTYSFNADPYLEKFAQRLEAKGADVEPLDFSGSPPIAAARRLDQLLRARRPTILHINSGSSAVRKIFQLSRARNDGYVRSVFTMHAPLSSAVFPSRVLWKDHLPFSWRWRTRRADQRFVKSLDRIISVSGMHADSLQRELHIPKHRLVTISNGVDTGSFVPDENRQQNGKVVVGVAGRLAQVKRFDIVIDAVAALSRKFPIALRIAGTGPNESKLQQRASEHGISDLVEFAGAQSNMPDFLRSLDVFCIASDSEGLPYAQLEAMATGLPSVVTSVGDLPRVVRDGIDGYVVPPRATEQLAERLMRLVRDREQRQVMGQNARQRVCESYSQERSSQATLDVFRNLISSDSA